MEDQAIVALYWQRDESAIQETQQKYGPYLLKIAYQILSSREDSEEILQEMERLYPQARVALTLGEKGSVYACRGERLYQGIYPVEAVDTTGAGDTFTGYLLAHMVMGDPMETCLERAARASALAVTKAGAASAIPYAAQL